MLCNNDMNHPSCGCWFLRKVLIPASLLFPEDIWELFLLIKSPQIASAASLPPPACQTTSIFTSHSHLPLVAPPPNLGRPIPVRLGGQTDLSENPGGGGVQAPD